jgi:hypothetical protein
MEANVTWSERDNLERRGEPDRRFVSLTERWELADYINRYLSTRGITRTPLRVEAILADIRRFDGSRPVLREEMTAYLDAIYLS